MTTVLYISYDGMTDPLGQSQVLPYLTGLSKKGFNIILISFEKQERFTGTKPLIEKLCQEAGHCMEPVNVHKKTTCTFHPVGCFQTETNHSEAAPTIPLFTHALPQSYFGNWRSISPTQSRCPFYFRYAWILCRRTGRWWNLETEQPAL